MERNANIRITFEQMAKLNALLKSSTDIPKLAIFDYDCNEIEFQKRVKACQEIKPLYTSLNFDLWLLLHKTNFCRPVQSNQEYIKFVRKKYNLDAEANIKQGTNIDKILAQINIEDLKFAIQNAKTILNGKLNCDQHQIGKNFFYYDNPSTNMHVFFEELLKEIGI